MSNAKPSLGGRLRRDWITHLNSGKHRILAAWICVFASANTVLSAVLTYINSDGELDAIDRFSIVVGFMGLILIGVFSVELFSAYRAKDEDLARKESQ
ncbi:MAG: hypothetical protein RBU21_16975 [FCB group bacterium]|jgi:hypothetical protein|nr:hypothetical protein [FCB group bacterium]